MIAATIVVIIAVGAAAFFVLSSGSGPLVTRVTSSSTAATASTESMSSNTPSSSAASTSTESISCSSAVLASGLNSTSVSSPFLSADYAPLFGNFSAMTISLRVNDSGTTSTENTVVVSSYNVVGTSGSGHSEIYDLSVNQQVPGSANQTLTAQLEANGTLVGASILGLSLPAAEASSTFTAFMSPFAAEVEAQSTLGASAAAYKLVNQTTITLGPSTLDATNYESATGPITVSECGQTTSIMSMELQTAELPGSAFTLVTYQHEQVETQTTSSSESSNFTLQVLSVA